MKGLQADVARMHLAKSHNLGNISEETPSSVSKAPGPAPAAAGSAAPARAEAPRTGDLEIQSSGTSFSVQALKMNADLAKSIMEANKATLNKGGVVGSKTGNVSAGGASASGAPVASSSTGGKRTSRLIRSTSEAAGPGSDGGANKKVTWGDGDFAEGAEQPDHSKPSGRNLVGWGGTPAPRATPVPLAPLLTQCPPPPPPQLTAGASFAFPGNYPTTASAEFGKSASDFSGGAKGPRQPAVARGAQAQINASQAQIANQVGRSRPLVVTGPRPRVHNRTCNTHPFLHSPSRKVKASIASDSQSSQVSVDEEGRKKKGLLGMFGWWVPQGSPPGQGPLLQRGVCCGCWPLGRHRPVTALLFPAPAGARRGRRARATTSRSAGPEGARGPLTPLPTLTGI